MIIKLGTNSSPKNQTPKTVTYPEVGQKTGTLKDQTSITNPTIIVEGVSHLFDQYNYMEIPKFGRKYFITEITSVRKGLVEITGHCDVLCSADAALRKNKCIVENLQSGFNRKINDGSFLVYQDRYVINAFAFTESFNTSDYVLALAGS